MSLRDFFERRYGGEGSASFLAAQRNFATSLAGYCVISFLMRIRDRSDCLYFFDRSNRHNGNILLHGDGRLVHIDFGFFISTSPGGLNWESAPFKLTRDYTEVLGPREGGAFSIFRSALVKAFLAARQNIEAIMQVVDTAFAGD